MDMGIITKTKQALQSLLHGDERSSTLNKNIVLSVIFKVAGVSFTFFLFPIAISYVDTAQFGIWLILSSLASWFSLLDLGLTNGLRNKLVKALNDKDYQLAKTYISTTYIVLSVIFAVVWLLFFFINQYINWVDLLNISQEYASSISKLVIIVFTYFCLFFLLKIINTVLLANQKAAYSSLIDLVSQFFTLAVIFLMTKFAESSLLYLFLGMGVAPIIVGVIFNIVLFRGKYKKLAPSFSCFSKWCIKDLMKLGGKFFVIQTAAIMQYQTANVIIAYFFNTSEVTNYNIAFKYFSLLSIFFMIALQPLWSATTDAYNKGDYKWITNTTKKYLILFVLLCFSGVLMLFVCNFMYDLWIGKNVVSITFTLSFWCLVYMITSMFGNIFVNTLNGIGAVKLQFIFSLFTPFLYIALCIVFIKYLNMGIYAVLVAAILSNINGFVIAPIQYIKIFLQNKKGIWVS